MRDQMIHIQKVHIQGYKSILDAEVEFLPGLNVIIGKNGAGKSNLLAAMEGVLLARTRTILSANVGVGVALPSGKVTQFTFDSESRKRYVTPRHTLLFVNSSETDFWQGTPEELAASGTSTLAEVITITHSLPAGIPFLDLKVSLKVGKTNHDLLDTLAAMTEPSTPYFCRSAFAEIHRGMIAGEENWFLKPEDHTQEIQKIVSVALGIDDIAIDELIAHTPIEDVRLGQNFSISKFGEKRFQINNISYEFKIGGNWLPFGDLSDGTQRLIYIFLSLGKPKSIVPSEDGQLLNLDARDQVIFVEEPEIGIHPHQLHQLLQFLKAQARKHQIIITTHSPQVLDVLKKDELDRILIASYDDKLGSQFKHLDDAQKEKAMAYMQDDLLSDYWRFSDLEARPML